MPKNVNGKSLCDSGNGNGYFFTCAKIPIGRQWFMTHVTCRLTAKNRDQLRNPTLGNHLLRLNANAIQ